MISEKNSIKAEEIIFYIDLLTDFIKKKHLLKGIKSFIEEKAKFSIPSSYGIVMFQGRQNPVNVYNKNDFELIEGVLEDSWNSRETTKSYFENGVFEILSYIFGQAKTGKHKNYRIIILSDTPSLRSEDYSTAVYDLIVKSKSFSTSIDVIRVGRELNYPDEVKLKVITSETQGGAFYCSDYKHFLDVLGSLVKNRQEFNIVKGEGEGISVLDEDKTFYEKLAVDLISLDPGEEEICTACEMEICPVCEAFSDEISKCFNCGTKFHSCCAAKFAISNNVGFRHIFKCPQCQTLLKLDEELVDDVYRDEFGGEVEDKLDEEFFEEESDKISKYSYDSYVETQTEEIIEEEQNVEGPPIDSQEIQVEEKLEVIPDSATDPTGSIEVEASPPPGPPPEMIRTVKVGGFFGQEIEIRESSESSSSPEKKKTIPEVPKKTIDSEEKDQLSITKLRPPRKRGSIKFCKICGASVSGTTKCPNCGAKID
jgi:hypothetical protein